MNKLRKPIMLGTAGHVDHGKTAVVKLLTGCNLDSLAEEQERGMTIDLGFAPCQLSGDHLVGVVDVPGHADFIRNMVAGAHGIDVVIFVVAADDGVMPQTREHLNILTLMGLRQGLVALTKIDLVAPDARAAVIADVRRLLSGTFLANAPLCPLSTITGEGFEQFYETLNAVVEACEDRPSNGLFHLWVEDVFSPRGAGTVITGIPTNGVVRVGDAVELVPGGQTGRVRRLQVYGEDAQEGRAGECVAMNLAELDHQAAKRGMVLGHAKTIQAVEMMEAELLLLPDFRGELKDYAEVHLHLGTAAVSARIALLERPRMAAGERQWAQLRLAQPLGVVPGERFVIRANVQGGESSGLATIGGGRLVGVSNTKLRRNKAAVLEELALRRDTLDNPVAWCETILRTAGVPLDAAGLAKAGLVRSEEAHRALTTLQANGTALPAGEKWIHRVAVESLAASVLKRLQVFHLEQPARLGMERAELQKSAGTEPAVFELAISHLLETRQASAQGTVLCVMGWQAKVTSEEERLYQAAVAALRLAGWTPPSALELATQLQQPLPRAELLLRRMVERGEARRISPELVLHVDAVEAAKQVILKLFAKGPNFTTMDFRDALGVSRKFAVPLLDYLDAQRFTVRSGNVRMPGAEAKKRIR